MSYTPRTMTDAVLQREFQRVAEAFNNQNIFLPKHSAPSKVKVGMVEYADGTDWNPGSGEGLYIYKTTGWVLLG